MKYKDLSINVSFSSISFLSWLVSIKQFDALSIIRVLEKPEQNNVLYHRYLEEMQDNV